MAGFKGGEVAINDLGVCKMAFRGVESAVAVIESPELNKNDLTIPDSA